LQRQRARHRRNELWEIVEYKVRQRLTQRVRVDPKLAALVEQVMQGQMDPRTAATRILDDADTVQQWLMPGNSG
jgi:putative protein kinase ArgK-like GTPase of G3E family